RGPGAGRARAEGGGGQPGRRRGVASRPDPGDRRPAGESGRRGDGPVHPGGGARPLRGGARGGGPQGVRMKILIGEDEMISRCLLQGALTNWGHEVVAVADGLAAWQALQGPDAPRLAILDWEMPGMEGPEVCRKVRARPVQPPPYLLLLTAKEGREN